MRCVIVYDRKSGDCRTVARAIASGISETGHDVYLSNVHSVVGIEFWPDCILIGSATRRGRATRAIRRLVKRGLPDAFEKGLFVAFGTVPETRTESPASYSAGEIHRMLEERGLESLTPPFTAIVSGGKGPVPDGEVERAKQFGRGVGIALRGKRRRWFDLERAV